MNRNENGQALPIVLAFFALGTLVIVPSLGHSASTLKLTRIVSDDMRAVYAADAGVENTIWSLLDGSAPAVQLPESINGANVSIQTTAEGTYTVVFGELIEPEQHSSYLQVSSNLTLESQSESGYLYRYTVTVALREGAGDTTIHLSEVGISLPGGYSYQSDSSASFGGNLSVDEPEVTQDFLRWEFSSPRPEISPAIPSATQSFYVTGDVEPQGNYAWVVAARSDVSEVGEISGLLYLITASATGPGPLTARTTAVVMIVDGRAEIISWKVSK